MKDGLTLLAAAACLLCGVSFLRAVRKLAKQSSMACCRRALALLAVLAAAGLVMGIGPWAADWYGRLMETKALLFLRENLFSERNYEVQYLVFYLLGVNLLWLAAGLVLWYGSGLLKWSFWKERPLSAWEAVLGRWLWNLSDGLMLLLAAEALAGTAALFVRLPFLQGKTGAQTVSGWFLWPALLWMVTAAAAGSFTYRPQHALETEEVKKPQKRNREAEKELLCRLAEGACIRVEQGAADDFLADYLYECFQKRRRVLVLCENGKVRWWQQHLETLLACQYDRTCLIRIGEYAHIRNRQDVDILVTDINEPGLMELERIDPFWFHQTGTILIADTHRLMARTGRQADVFFSMWLGRRIPMQFLFFNCSLTEQEREALEYYAGRSVEDVCLCADRQSQDMQAELVPWRLVSPRAMFRRLLLVLQQEGGVSEKWLNRQKKRFGMEELQTEEFLRTAVESVCPNDQIQNIYDAFLFQEEPGQLSGSWRVRLTDAGILEQIRGEDSLCADSYRYPDCLYQLQQLSPLGSSISQGARMTQLYQTQLQISCRGVFHLPETGKASDFDSVSYEKWKEERELLPGGCETVVLQLGISCRESGERRLLEELLGAVCNEVLGELFPWNKGELAACCSRNEKEQKERSPVPGVQLPDGQPERRDAEDHVLCLWLVERNGEHGLTALLHQNSGRLIQACRRWLERADEEPTSREAALMNYMIRERQSQLLLPMTSEEGAGQLLSPVRLLKNLLCQ